MLISSVSSFFPLDYHQQTEEELSRMKIEGDLQKELKAVKVSIVYISPNLCYYQVP
jgi:hypothetical protein